MADRVLFISWGSPVRGREERALEVFNDGVGLYGRMQQEGRIESFEIVLLNPTSLLAGYIELKGDAAQIQAVQEDAEFQRVMTDASLIVDDLNIVPGYTNAGVAEQMATYAEAIAKVPQSA
jgi:hypothetical protein